MTSEWYGRAVRMIEGALVTVACVVVKIILR